MTAETGVESVRNAVEIACRAPSLHNSQPWLWHLDGVRLELRADATRSLPVADPLGRQMMISCGVALHHLSIAVRRFGLAAVVDRLPDPRDPLHVATVTFEPVARVRQADVETATGKLQDAISVRRTDRRAFGAPRDGDLAVLGEDLTARFGASVTVLGERGPARLAEASRLSASARRYDPNYHAELFWWTGHRSAPHGVPGSALPAAGAVPVGRQFPIGTLGSTPGPDRAALAVIGTEADTRLDWVRSGEALSHVLLGATARGLATCPLTHITEVAVGRGIVADAVAADGGTMRFPQVVVRLGTAPEGGAPPRTERRPFAEVWSS